jgi:O-antigen ligase
MSSDASRSAPPQFQDAWQLSTTLLLAAAVVAPLVVVSGTFFPYVVPRNILFSVAVELATAVLAVRLSLGRVRLSLRGEYVLIALTAFVLAMTVSAIFSPARSHSFFGDFERMGGVWAWLHYALFFLLLRTLDEKYLHALFLVAMLASVGAAAHGILGCVSLAAPLTIIGNPGLLAGYLMLGIASALWLASNDIRYRSLYIAAIGVAYVALLIAGNRSSLVGLVAGATVGAGFITMRAAGRLRWVPLATVAGLILATIALAVVSASSGRGCLLGGPPTVVHRIAATDFAGADAARTTQWNAAVAGFRDRPLLGYGPENHHLVWSAHFDTRIESLGPGVFDRVHNQFLEVLATTGLCGTLAFLALWLAIGHSIRRGFVERRLSVYQVAVLTGANVAYAVYLVFWFVDINAAILWLLLLAVAAARCGTNPVLLPASRGIPPVTSITLVLATVVFLAWNLYSHAYVPARLNVALATLDSYDGDRERAAKAVHTIAESTAPQTSHNGAIVAQYINTLSSRGELYGADSTRSTDSGLAFRTAIAAFAAELERDPLNDRLHSQYAAFLLTAYDFYEDPKYLERAVRMAKRAIELTPGRTQHRRLLERIENSRRAR